MNDRDRIPPGRITDDLRTRAWRRTARRGQGAALPLLAIAATIVIIFIIVVNMGDRPNTQMGQNAGRPSVTTQPPATSPPVPQ